MLGLSIFMLFTAGVTAYTAEIKNPGYVYLGDTFKVNVTFDLNESTKTVAFDFLFNPAIITALTVDGDLINTSCTAAGGTPQFGPGTPIINNTAGKIRFEETCLGAGVHFNGTGNAAVITFNASSLGLSNLSLQNIEIHRVINFILYYQNYTYLGDKTVVVIQTRVTSTNVTGAQEVNVFYLGELIYARGSGFVNSSNVSICIVNHTSSWTDGMLIPADVRGSCNASVQVNGTGGFGPVLLWNGSVLGSYDISVDQDRDGYYNVTRDGVDSTSEVGFYIYPEAETVILLAVGLLVLFGFVTIKKKQPGK